MKKSEGFSLFSLVAVIGLFLFLGGLSASFFEFVDASCRIDEFLLAGVKRMAGAADFYMLLFFRRTSNDHVLAGTNDLCLGKIGWVDILLHDEQLSGNSFDLALHFLRLVDHHSSTVVSTFRANVVRDSHTAAVAALHEVHHIRQTISRLVLKFRIAGSATRLIMLSFRGRFLCHGIGRAI